MLLYRQKLTYGELEQKQYEFGRDAMVAELAFTQAVIARDDDRQALAVDGCGDPCFSGDGWRFLVVGCREQFVAD